MREVANRCCPKTVDPDGCDEMLYVGTHDEQNNNSLAHLKHYYVDLLISDS